jgi:hypothetical protein
MLKRTFQILIKFLPIIVLMLVWFLLLISNFTSNTWLSGWDNLHPEFNFPLNIKRSLYAAWQEYQGTGLVGGMAHAADLPRQIILWLVSFILPAHLLRYFWVFLMLLIGPLGVYYFTSKILLEGKKTTKSLAGLVAGLFYLLNLATVQYFFTPFETFVSFYGFFPWLLYFALKYLKSGKTKNLLRFVVVSFLATPSFYVQTLFIVYLFVLSVFVLEIVIKERRTGFIRSLKLGLSLLAANAFWLLPVVYFSLTNAQVVQQAKINSIATSETQIMNEAAGNVKDIASLKGFWFNYMDLTEDNKFDYLYKDWISYLNNNPLVNVSAYILFSLSLGGLVSGLFQKKNRWRFSGLLVLALSYFMLATTNAPFGSLFKILSEKVPLFIEVFRSVFTKWSIVTAFSCSLGLAYLVCLIAKISKNLILPILVAIVLIFQMIIFVKPSFEGSLISNTMKVEIPSQYFEVFEYFGRQPKEKRIAFLPAQTFWGWNFYDWGYRGSGFLWYGLEQPILDRAFDVWSTHNESFYNQLSLAIYSEDLGLLENTLQKFQVTYLILDESIIMPGGNNELLYIDEIQELVDQSEHIRLTQVFGFLSIYQTDFAPEDNYVWAPKEFALIDADLTYSKIDPVYGEFGTYVYDKEGITTPFVNLDFRKKPEVTFDGNSLKIISDELVFSGEKRIFAPEAFEENSNMPNKPSIKINEEKRLEETFGINEKGEDYISKGLDGSKNCNLKAEGNVSKEIRGDKVFYSAENNAAACDFYNYPELLLSQGYLLRIKGENLSGRSLKAYLQNWGNDKIDFETLLPKGKFDETFFVLPKDIEGSGYTLNLETRSFGRISSQNILEKIEFIPIPIEVFQKVKLVPESYSNVGNDIEVIESRKVGTSYYNVQTNSNEGLVVLSQGYESGWLGFGFKEDSISFFNRVFPWFFGNYLKHVKVNSWANGWFVPKNSQRLILVFWPQYLEYFGIAVSVVGLIWLYNKKGKSHLTVDKSKGRRLK